MILDIVLWVLHIVSVIMSILSFIFGIYEQLVSKEKALKVLRKMHINLQYYQVALIAFVSVLTAGVTYGVLTDFST